MGATFPAGADVTVRPAEPADVHGLVGVHIRSWQGGYEDIFDPEFLAGLDSTVEERTARWHEYLDGHAEERRVSVATVGGEVVGFAHFGEARLHRYHDDDGTEDRENPDTGRGELFAIYVDPGHWGRGAGAALMADAIEGLTGAGYSEALLWVLEDNTRALSFYDSFGWRPDGRRDLFTRGTVTAGEICLVRPLP